MLIATCSVAKVSILYRKTIEDHGQGDGEGGVYTYDDEKEDGKFWHIKDCVWEGPPFLRSKVSLKHVPGYEHDMELKDFFRSTLGIRNSNWKDYLAELKLMQENEIQEPDQVLELYRRLSKSSLTDVEWKFMRYYESKPNILN